MAKDELNSDSTCPECNQENREPEYVEADDCSCSCSCSDTSSDADVKNSDGGSHVLSDIEKRKKDLLSSLSIRRTNQEPASIQHVLQFVEALTHSSEFFRRYNFLDDFCLDCLIHEPTYLCCSGDLQRQDSNHSSCEECRGPSEVAGCSTQTCSECVPSRKPLRSRRQRAEARRERRQRRRQRRHVSRTAGGHHRSPRHAQYATSNSRDCSNNPVTNTSKSKSSAHNCNDNCVECAHETNPNQPLLRTCNSSDSDVSDSDKKCTEESKECSIDGCTECRQRRRRQQQKSRRYRRSGRNADESCSSCSPQDSNQSARPLEESKACSFAGCTDCGQTRPGQPKNSRKNRRLDKSTDESCCSSCSSQDSNQSG